jgi:hypothetical protein
VTARWPLVLYRLPLALLTLAAIVAQFKLGLHKPSFNAVNFFSYFTILSNSFAVIVLLWAVVARPSRDLDVTRGAVALCLLIVGIVFALLLRNLDQETIPWVNTVVHEVMPAAMAVDWLLDPPLSLITVSDLISWLVFPLGYLVYTLFRGSVVGWYPYPFLNPDMLGYSGVALYCGGIFFLALTLAIVLLVSGNMRRGFTASSF